MICIQHTFHVKKYVECNTLVIGGAIREKNLDDLILIK